MKIKSIELTMDELKQAVDLLLRDKGMSLDIRKLSVLEVDDKTILIGEDVD